MTVIFLDNCYCLSSLSPGGHSVAIDDPEHVAGNIAHFTAPGYFPNGQTHRYVAQMEHVPGENTVEKLKTSLSGSPLDRAAERSVELQETARDLIESTGQGP